MSYFKELSDYQTYAHGQDDFHFVYNANSGGGQSFLGGKYINEKGELSSPTNLDGCVGVFSILLKEKNNIERYIELNDEKGRYEIKPRGEGSSSMKLGIGTKMVSPSKLISAFFMLPPTCTIKSPSNLENSILTANNFWLQSMWLKCKKHSSSDKQFNLVPIDFVYCGGCNKDQQESVRYFELEGQKRVEDLISISEKINLIPSYLHQCVEVFTNIYLGENQFDYDLCLTATKQIMSLLAKNYPDRYAGIEDPLPFLMALAFPANQRHKISQTPFKETPHQQIYYGAPGTGKSFMTNEVAKKYSTIRTTFHPDSDYSTFVGAYKPITVSEKRYGLNGSTTIALTYPDGERSGEVIEDKKIGYRFVKQAFMKAYVGAWKKFAEAENGDDATPQFLVIEEINRGNCAQIFGDLFQLLDRKNGFSEYPIDADEDICKSLLKEDEKDDPAFGKSGLQFTEEQKEAINAVYNDEETPFRDVAEEIAQGKVLVLPRNFYIWATMNTSDQSLFPIDSAFKRRWEWKYVRICEGKKKDGTPLDYRIKFTVPAKDEQPEIAVDVPWWDFVTAINKQIEDATKSEDKKLGYFFCKPDKKANDADECNTIISAETFVGKVVFYLWQDVFKDYGFKSDIFKRADKSKISFHDFYPDNIAADEQTNPEAIDLQLVKEFIDKVIEKDKEKAHDSDNK